MTDTRAAAVAPPDRGSRHTRRQDIPSGGADGPRRENEALRRRAARLSAAVRRLAGAARGDGRSRAEPPAAASRRLLIPLTSIKGSTAAALDAPAALDQGGMRQLFRIIDEQADRLGDLIGGVPEARGGRIGTGDGETGEGPRPGRRRPRERRRPRGGGSGRTARGTTGDAGREGAGMVAGLNRAFGALCRILEEEHPGTASRLLAALDEAGGDPVEGYRDRVTGRMRSMLGRIRAFLLGIAKSTSPRIAR